MQPEAPSLSSMRLLLRRRELSAGTNRLEIQHTHRPKVLHAHVGRFGTPGGRPAVLAPRAQAARRHGAAARS